MSATARASIPFVVAVVGGKASGGGERARLLEPVIADVVRDLRRRFAREGIEVITLADGDDTVAVAGELARQGCLGWAPAGNLLTSPMQTLPPDFCGFQAGDPEAAARLLCRYAHILIDIVPVRPTEGDVRDAVLAAWRSGGFGYGDDKADDEQLALLEAPTGGAVVTITQPSDAKARTRRNAWRLSWESDEAEKEGVRKLKGFARMRRALNRADARTAAQRSENFLSAEKLDAAGVRLRADPDGFDCARALFGRASAQSRAAKRVVDVFNYIYALTLVVATVGYEIINIAAPSAPAAALWLYVGVIGTFLLIAFILDVRGDHTRLLDLRVTAELLRAQCFWRLAGVKARLETSVRRWLPGVAPEVEAAARAIDFLMARTPAPAETHVPFVAQWIETQIAWHGQSANAHKRREHLLEMSQLATFIAAFGIAVLLLATTYHWRAREIGIFEAIAISALPAVAGGFAILRERFAYQALSANYQRMHRLALSAREKLAQADGEARKQRIVEQFGRETIRESIEWMLTHRLHRIDPRGI